MELLVANVDNVKFDIEVALEQQLGAQPLPFVGMDKSTAAICVFYVEGSCVKGAQCPFRHVRGDRTVVCKHWLRGLCKKGDQCEFLHEYDMTKMPECYFYTRFNACHNKECPFLHIDPESKVRPCPWYDRGFCRHGPHCRHRHIRKVLCLNYLAGFCLDGPECKFVHAQFDLPQVDELAKQARKAGIICHLCQEAGHKSYQCPRSEEFTGNKNQNQESDSTNSNTNANDSQQEGNTGPTSNTTGNPGLGRGGPGHLVNPGGDTSIRPPRHHFSAPPTYQPYQFHPRPLYPVRHHRGDRGERHENKDGEQHPRRALEDVVCYKCGYKGHYANKCDKGHLAFLSHKAGGGGGGPGGGGLRDREPKN